MSDTNALIELLARPGIHSGTALGEQLGISRVAIKKRIDRLAASGFPVESVSGRGYQVNSEIELFSAAAVNTALEDKPEIDGLQLEIFQSLDSTNSYLASQDIKPGEFRVVVAESQPAGQGRRGRNWVASPYQNLMLSVGYTYSGWPQNPAGISLAFSVAVHGALQTLGVESVSLKWPNDLMVKNAKLGGLLVTAAGEAGGDLSLTLGVGINIALDDADAAAVDQDVIDLRGLGHAGVSRNQLLAEIISNTREMLELYPQTGFEPFAEYWNKYALHLFEDVRLFDREREYSGRLLGVDKEGQLLIVSADGVKHRFNTSDLSLRKV